MPSTLAAPPKSTHQAGTWPLPPVEVAPMLLAAFVPLSLWGANWAETSALEALAAALLCAAGAGLAWSVMRLLIGERYGAVCGAVLLVLYLFSYEAIFGLAMGVAARFPALLVRDQALRVALNVGLVLALAALRHYRPNVAGLARGLRLFALVLFGGGVAMLAGQGLMDRSARVPAPETVLAELPAPAEGSEPRDIYYLVFDRYADAETLRRHFHWDNAPFLEELRARGFAVAEEARANYPKTEISMASSLNLRYHGERLAPLSQYREEIQEHAVGRLLRGRGYRYFHLGCPLEGLRRNPQAEVNYRFSPLPGEFSEILFRMTPFYSWFPTTDIARQEEEKFDLLPRIAAAPGPKFVYAHFLLPHPPWKFDAEGNRPGTTALRSATDREHYRAQLAFTNRRILETIDRIRENSAREPLLLITADEGPELRYPGDALLSPAARIRKRSGILLAAALPERPAAELLPRRATPVNLFRLVFREYFGAPLEPLPERVFYWEPANEIGKPRWTESTALTETTNLVWPRREPAGAQP